MCTAVQMWVLACYLPVMVGKYVQTDDEYWDNYLTLLHITDYVVAPEITIDEVAYLKILIEEHQKAFVVLYPEANVIPKQHYLIHTPYLVSRYIHSYTYIYTCI